LIDIRSEAAFEAAVGARLNQSLLLELRSARQETVTTNPEGLVNHPCEE
jgi:hypothetical protein